MTERRGARGRTGENRVPAAWPAAAALGLLLLLLHVQAGLASRDPRLLLPHAVAWLHDLLLLLAAAAVAAGLARAAPPRLRPAASWGGRSLLAILGALLAVCPQLLPAFLAAPASFLAADAAAAQTFLRDYLGPRASFPAALAVAAALLAPRGRPLYPGRRLMLALAPLLVLALATLGRESPNPVLFGLQDGLRQLLSPRAVPRLRAGASVEAAPLAPPRLDWSAAGRAPRYDHVLVVVLEGVTADRFEARLRTGAGGFLAEHRGRARYFSRWHTTNLDSYTALLAMTSSIQVPFRAYAAPERYAAVGDAPSLPAGLRAAGFRTLFASTYEHQPFIPNPGAWDRVLDRRGLGELSGWVSVGGSRMEAATEDRAALDPIVDFVRRSPRSLVLAELVFGHSPEWRARTGIEPLDYCDRYLSELRGRLAAAGLERRTLLVVVSDHGDRAGAAEPASYRVPLLLLGEGVEPGQDGELRSHLDLQAVIAHELLGAPPPPARPAIWLVGSTERWVYGELRSDGQHALVDDGAGRVLSGRLDPAALQRGFQRYVEEFAGAFPPLAAGGTGHAAPGCRTW
jgi:hypothetical protein